jgi:exopolyphosphatase/guanosine-5'-triphosphate,3'-diphosphate pyrophosphatase
MGKEKLDADADRRKDTGRASRFPLRAAAVDIGSNAIRFMAAEFRTARDYEVLENERAAVRLGHDVFLTGRLRKDAMEAALEALSAYRQKIESLEIPHVSVVATSAVRTANNGPEFVARVKKDTGLRIQIISGPEESRLIHAAVRTRIPLGKEHWILVDLGGGSVEVALVDGDCVLWSESHTLGSVRLLEELAGYGENGGRFLVLLEEYVQTLRLPSRIPGRFAAGFIATGGNIEALADLAGAPPDAAGVSTLPLGSLRSVIETLGRLPFAERVSRLGLREDRADVILPAALVYERLCRLCEADVILVPRVGLREGVLLDLVADLTAESSPEQQHEQEMAAAAVHLGRRFFFDEGHSLQVTALTLQLFDSLGKVHKLGARERRLLHAAAILHDVGQYISFKKHHKHSMYLISESELPGLEPEEVQIVANIARYHRKSEPAHEHEEYMRLSHGDRQKVDKLAAILRLADALDREHAQKVTGVSVGFAPGEIVLYLRGSGDLSLELWFLKKKAEMFTKVYGLEVRAVAERK